MSRRGRKAIGTDEGDEASPAAVGYEPQVMGQAIPASVATLGELAAQGTIVVCVGAGVSMGPITQLPSGREVAERLFAALDGSGYREAIDGCSHDNLLCIADAMEEVAGGEDLVQQLVRQIANFAEAAPNFAHEALALLMLEGAVEGISLNWDCCIEATPQSPDRIEVVTTQADFLHVQGARVHKVHGCVRRGPRLLVSTRQIEDPPTWVVHELGGRLGGSTIVFVGVGDIPAYVRLRIAQLRDVMNVEHVYVVDPTVSEAWEELMPGLSEARKIAESGQLFFDELLRAYVRVALRRLEAETGSAEQLVLYQGRGIDMATGLLRLRQAVNNIDAKRWVVFLRGSRYEWPHLQKVVQSTQVLRLLSAVAALAARSPIVFEPTRSRFRFPAKGRWNLIPLAANAQGSARVVKEAAHRVKLAMAAGQYAPGDEVVVVCDGHTGPLARPDVPPSVMEPGDSSELVSAQEADWLRVMSAEELLEGAVPLGWEAA